MPSRVNNPSADTEVVGVFGVGEGGTAGTTPQEALENLNAVPRATIGLPGGAIPLNGSGLIDEQYIGQISSTELSIDGPKKVVVNDTAIFYITTYDEFKTYTAEAVNGSVRVENGIIYYTAPDTPGMYSFKINGRQIEIEAVAYLVQRPRIVSPQHESSSLFTDITIVSSPFISPNTTEVHESSDWEISKFEDFREIYKSYYGSANKTSWTATELEDDQQYYVRVRHHGSTGVSLWSETVAFYSESHGYIVTPTITAEKNLGGLTPPYFSVSGSEFTTVIYTDSHVSTDWRIATDPEMENLVVDQVANDEEKRNAKFSLDPSTVYYISARYRGTEKVSQWSEPISITTMPKPDVNFYIQAGGGAGAPSATVGYPGGGGGAGGLYEIYGANIKFGEVIKLAIGYGGLNQTTGIQAGVAPLKFTRTSGSGSVSIEKEITTITIKGRGGSGSSYSSGGQPYIAPTYKWGNRTLTSPAGGTGYETQFTTANCGVVYSRNGGPAAPDPSGPYYPSGWQSYKLTDPESIYPKPTSAGQTTTTVEYYSPTTQSPDSVVPASCGAISWRWTFAWGNVSYTAVIDNPGQPYIPPSTTYTTGDSTTFTINGQTYTFPGGYGGAATEQTYTITLPGTAAMSGSYSVGSGGMIEVTHSGYTPQEVQVGETVGGTSYVESKSLGRISAYGGYPGSSSGTGGNYGHVTLGDGSAFNLYTNRASIPPNTGGLGGYPPLLTRLNGSLGSGIAGGVNANGTNAPVTTYGAGGGGAGSPTVAGTIYYGGKGAPGAIVIEYHSDYGNIFETNSQYSKTVVSGKNRYTFTSDGDVRIFPSKEDLDIKTPKLESHIVIAKGDKFDAVFTTSFFKLKSSLTNQEHQKTEYQVSLDSDFSTVLYSGSVASNETEFSVLNLNFMTNYYVRVRHVTDKGQSRWSEVMSINGLV